ncbi:MAG: hypothetical protein ACRDKT_01350 [Actinomycetota bacterium]
MTAQTDAPALATRRAAAPWTVIVVVVLMILMAAAQHWADRFALTYNRSTALRYLVDLANLVIVLGLIANGLWRRSRIAWLLAILWQVVSAGYGGVHVVSNGYGWAAVSNFTQVGFYEGALPLVVGATNIVLLLLHATRAWVTRPST